MDVQVWSIPSDYAVVLVKIHDERLLRFECSYFLAQKKGGHKTAREGDNRYFTQGGLALAVDAFLGAGSAPKSLFKSANGDFGMLDGTALQPHTSLASSYLQIY